MTIKTLITAIAIMLSSAHACANIVYSGGRSVGGYDFTFSIETDGSLGPLTNANIVGFATSLPHPVINFTGYRLSFSDGAVTATTAGLFFDPLGPDAAVLMINYSTLNAEWSCVNGEYAQPKPTYLLSKNGSTLFEAFYVSEHEVCPLSGQTFQDLDEEDRASGYAYLTGPVQIGLSQSTVPEPGTLVLLALGLAGLGWSRRRQCPRIE